MKYSSKPNSAAASKPNPTPAPRRSLATSLAAWVIFGSAFISALAPPTVYAAETGADAADTADTAPILPYRPTVSNPAQLPVPGQLEVELGGVRARSDGSRRSSVPYLLKLAFNPEWGVLIGGEALADLREDGRPRQRGVGDTMVELKRAWTLDADTAFGIEFGANLPSAKEALGSGRADYLLNAIYSRDLGPVHLDVNLSATRVGTIELGTSRTRVDASMAFSGALTERWGLAAELSGMRRSGADNGSQVLTALTYSPNKRLTFDFGVARAARPAPATTSVFAGVVFPLARLW